MMDLEFNIFSKAVSWILGHLFARDRVEIDKLDRQLQIGDVVKNTNLNTPH